MKDKYLEELTEEINDRYLEDIECPSCKKLTIKARTYSDGSYQQFCEVIGCWRAKSLPGRVKKHCLVCDGVSEHIIYRDIYGKPYAEKCVKCQTRSDIIYC